MTEEEIEEVVSRALEAAGSSSAATMLYQFTYRDPETGLTYEVFYDFDVDRDQAIVACALLEGRKIRLTRELRQRMTQAAFWAWVRDGIAEASDSLAGSLQFAFDS